MIFFVTGFFGAILAWDKFKYFTKIAYAVYLVQFPLFFFNVGKTKHADEFSISEMVSDIWKENFGSKTFFFLVSSNRDYSNNSHFYSINRVY